MPALLLIAWAHPGHRFCAQAAQPAHAEANVMVEITLTASRHYEDPFNRQQLDLVFTTPLGQTLRVPGFWAGGNVWKVRYASSLIGTHNFRSEFSETQDTGLHGVKGKVVVKAYTGKNPLYAHGPLRVAANKRFLEHADQTPFFWLGDTWWMGLCHRLHWPDEFQQLAQDRKEKGFNVIQIVAGLYPDMPPFDPRGANEAGFPWETNYSRIRPEYFDAADQRLRYLADQGFVPCIVGAWGYFMPWMGVEKMKAHWRYLIARYGALPVVWCAAGEANLPYYLTKGFPYDDREQVHHWTEILRYIRQTDPFHRPLTMHPTAIKEYTSRHATEEPSLLDFDMLQTPHGRREAVPVTVKAVRGSFAAQPVMPVIDGEASYEMLGDSLPTEWTRRMFWLCVMNGAAGHTYGANGIWQCNRPGQPHGPSPGGSGNGYGRIPWNQAMLLPGSRQVGLGKQLLERYPWTRFEPHPEWAGFTRGQPVRMDGGHWVWFPEGNPTHDAPAEKRYFRRTFELPAGKKIESASLCAAADDWFEARLNGVSVGSGDDWRSGPQFNHLESLLKPGKNVLAILAGNRPIDLAANPAGLIARLEVRFAQVSTNKPSTIGQYSAIGIQYSVINLDITTDAQWRCARAANNGWDAITFDDSGWTNALVIANYGGGPWGQMASPADESYDPQATGIPGGVRIIYVPDNESVVAQRLNAGVTYRATYFDPVSGGFAPAGTVRSKATGAWTCPPPPGEVHDWVLILEPRTK